MGGLGKSTLVTKVYHHKAITQHFRGGLAWAYVSKQFHIRSVLQEVLADLNFKSNDYISETDLVSKLRALLREKRCLVVLDDVWSKEAWGALKSAFSSCGGDSGSKVLITTRKQEVAKDADPKALGKPGFLNEDESWELLQKTLGRDIRTNVDGGDENARASTSIPVPPPEAPMKSVEHDHGHTSAQTKSTTRGDQGNIATTSTQSTTRGDQGNIATTSTQSTTRGDQTEVVGGDGDSARATTDSIGTDEVSKMNKLGKEMLTYCKGLPLAIVALGGILRNKDTLDEWETVHKNISSYLRRGYDDGRSYIEVLVHSYNDLPYHLKPCFLHLANFPEDYEIYTERLYWMWVAEGLVTWSRDRIAGTESLEDVANEYLSDLVHAGMVKIVKQTSNGRIKSVRVHDLMRDVCLQKATAENFLNIIDHRQCPEKPLNISSYVSHKRLLRMAIYSADGVNSYIPDSLSTRAHKYLRSLLFFTEGDEVEHQRYQEWIKHICTEFQWLRVLDLEGLCLHGRLAKKVKKLVHLRYFSLKETKVCEIPSCIGKLRFLQILDLRISLTVVAPIRLPNTLWKLDQLRHLLLPPQSYEIVGSTMLRVDTLVCLERLENLEAGKFEPKELLKLKNLRRLFIKDVLSKQCLNILLQSPALKSGCLTSVSFGVKGNVVSGTPGILSRLDCTHRLKLVEKITTGIKDVVFPRSLRVLHLESCKLEDDPMEVLGSLSHLKDLFLGVDSFVGTGIICKPRSFLRLIVFNLQGLMNLEMWTLGRGSLSKLRKLTIRQCCNLKKIPEGLPSSVNVTCSPCVEGIDKYGTCVIKKAFSFHVTSYSKHFIEVYSQPTSSLEAPLKDDKYEKVVLRGQGGIGKTTNVKALYEGGVIHQHFEAIAWACPPKRSDVGFPRRVWQGLLRDLNPTIRREDLSQMSCTRLIEEIQQAVQQKKCLVVLTNLENVDHHLEYLDTAFGSQGFGKGSKLLITTTDETIATTNEQLLVLDLPPPAETWPQLENKPPKTWPMINNKLTVASENKASVESLSSGMAMAKDCSTHPLSLVMLGGLLATTDNPKELENTIQNLKKRELPQIFELCYDALPLHLRYCLLSLLNFPRDIEISTKKLYQMWIAVGFVQVEDDEALSGDVLEDVTESYLDKLVKRGMVKVGKRAPTGKIKTCQLQFALQDLCLEKAIKEHVLTTVDLSGSSASVSDDDLLKLAIQLNKCFNHTISSPTSSKQQLSFRISSSPPSSLLFFPDAIDPLHKIEAWEWFIFICNQFQSLQVLDLEGMWMTKGSLPEEVGSLGNLKYLSLKGTWVSKLPSSIEKLTKLQTLDLRVLEHLVIPDVLCKLEYLRHLYFPDSIAPLATKLQLCGLEHLQTLVNLDTEYVHLNHLPKLKRVKRISILKIHAVKELDGILGSLSRSIELTMNSEIVNANQNILSSFQNLRKVRVKGWISVPLRREMFPVHLEELALKHTKIEQDPIPVLKKLRELRSLSFDHESFLGKEMTFSGDFHALTHLKFRSLRNLERLESPKKGMSNLVSTVIRDCWRLKVVNLPIKDPRQNILEI